MKKLLLMCVGLIMSCGLALAQDQPATSSESSQASSPPIVRTQDTYPVRQDHGKWGLLGLFGLLGLAGLRRRSAVPVREERDTSRFGVEGTRKVA